MFINTFLVDMYLYSYICIYKYLYEYIGEKTLKKTSLFGFGKGQKYEDAAECFQKAGEKKGHEKCV